MQPMEKVGIGIVRLVFMGVTLRGRNVTAIAVAELTAIGEGGMGKFLHRRLLDVGCYPHFQETGITSVIQKQRHENLRFFCAPAPLLPTVGPLNMHRQIR